MAENSAPTGTAHLMRALASAGGFAVRAMALVGAGWIALLALLICAEVIGRGAFNRPVAGLNEFVSLSMTPILFLQLPAVVLSGRLFRVELLTGRLRPGSPASSLYGLAYTLLLLALLAVVLPWMQGEAVKAWATGDYVGAPGAFEIQIWPFRWISLLGGLAMAMVALAMLGRDLATLIAGRGAAAFESWRPLFFCLACLAFGLGLVVLPESPLGIGAFFVVWLFVLLALGFPIATLLLGISALGIYLIRGSFRITEVTLGLSMTKSIATMEFAVLPLFIAMGLVLDKARLGEDAFRVAAQTLRRVRGGLAVATVASNAVFASVVGSSIASAAVFARVAVGPMIQAGFSQRRAVGTVAGSSVLGMLIPPSLLLIVYGLIAEVSIGQLFVAAVGPGLLLALGFAVLAWLMAPRGVADGSDTDEPLMDRAEILERIWPILLLISVVLGGIYTGWFTATEAAGVGLVLSVLIAVSRGRLPPRLLLQTAGEAGMISTAMLILMAAAGAYTKLLAFAQLPMRLNEFLIAADLGFYPLMLVFVLVVLALGAVLDSVSIILIITPIVLPLVQRLGADPVWFGILLTVTVEIGLLTPPFGVSAYVVREVLADRGVRLSDIFLGALPFALVMLLLVALLIVAPSLATFLL